MPGHYVRGVDGGDVPVKLYRRGKNGVDEAWQMLRRKADGTNEEITDAPPVTSTVFRDDFDGPEGQYFAWGTNSSHPHWYADHTHHNYLNLSGTGVGVKPGTEQFWRAWMQRSSGGPGKNIRVKARVRLTSVYDRSGSSIIEGLKFFLKIPSPNNPDQTAKGCTSTLAEYAPGSYAIFILTGSGRLEISRNDPAPSTGYDFTFTGTQNTDAPLAIGTWVVAEVTVEWLGDNTNRLTFYRDGTQLLQITDVDANYFQRSLFCGLRSDDATWEIDYFEVAPL